MSRRAKQRTGLAAIACIGILMLILWSRVMFTGLPQQVSTNSGPSLRAVYTETRWKGKPIYRLTNESTEDLHHFWITSWSEHDVPYLAIGAVAPDNLSRAIPLQNPPYTLHSKESVWFIGPSDPPAKFTVIWGANNQTWNYVLYIPNSN